MMTITDKASKRLFDIVFALIGLVLTGWVILLAIIVARIDTKMTGLFFQSRIGRNGKLFKVMKVRSMRDIRGYKSTVTSDADPRITMSGRFFRKAKIDELPQLVNVLRGEMSLVGPRPDVPGYADKLVDEDRIVLSVRPGITGPASIYYRNEEDILAQQSNPENYNRLVIWPHKVKLNKDYVQNYSFFKDFYYLYKTVV